MRDKLNGSELGVMTAPITNMAITACLRKLFKRVGVTIPTFVRKKMTMGNWNKRPQLTTNIVMVETYEVISNSLDISGLI